MTIGTPTIYTIKSCGSQARHEQTVSSDQDNALIIDDFVKPQHLDYFEQLSKFVCTGLHNCGFNYCSGATMATNLKWRQPMSVWQNYFHSWITTPNPQALMLASIFF
ncbi:hypothetical protein TI04_06350, partial [Achromatium sp. WMS2]